MRNIVTQQWLLNRLQDSEIRIIDCRFILNNKDEGRRLYENSHIPGAIYLDLEEDLSAPVKEHGGRHPIPDKHDLEMLFSTAGIRGNTTVVAYDDQHGAMAARLWWLLKYAGHERVFLLDGGFNEWKHLQHPVTNDVPQIKRTKFIGDFQDDLLVNVNDVKKQLNKKDVTIIDSREENRFIGVHEPIDPIAGHIPGAINKFWQESTNDEGHWKSKIAQMERFHDIDKNQEIIVYCGSGVSACPNIIALQESGFHNVKLYAGSWSDWCSYDELPKVIQKR